jgi:YHS domain-containing protein
MNLEPSEPELKIEHPVVGTQIVTACGGIATYSSSTTWAVYKGKVVYFCLPACKVDFLHNPDCSCLAGRMDEFK